MLPCSLRHVASRIAFFLTLLSPSPLAQESSSSTPPRWPPRMPAQKRPRRKTLLRKRGPAESHRRRGNDRAAMVRNLDAFLKKYPESSQRRKSIAYRGIELQLRDFPRATEYAERIVALNPEDTSMTVLSIQLLDRYGGAEGCGAPFPIARACGPLGANLAGGQTAARSARSGRTTRNATSLRCWSCAAPRAEAE